MFLGRTLAIAMAFQCLACGAAFAQTTSVAPVDDYLKNLREIGIEIDLFARPECIQPESSIRATIVNRIVPAGLSISSTSQVYFLFVIRNGCLPVSNICVTSVRTDVQAIESINSPLLVQRTVAVSLFDQTIVLGSRPQDSKNGLTVTIESSLNDFLARWRTVNAGAEFVRQQPSASPSPLPSSVPTGPNIRTVQQRLQTLGLYQGIVDGVSGPGTRQAVQVFQRSVQLPATGDLDIETMRRLFP